jgi:hypothetical protein
VIPYCNSLCRPREIVECRNCIMQLSIGKTNNNENIMLILLVLVRRAKVHQYSTEVVDDVTIEISIVHENSLSASQSRDVGCKTSTLAEKNLTSENDVRAFELHASSSRRQHANNNNVSPHYFLLLCRQQGFEQVLALRFLHVLSTATTPSRHIRPGIPFHSNSAHGQTLHLAHYSISCSTTTCIF